MNKGDLSAVGIALLVLFLAPLFLGTGILCVLLLARFVGIAL